MRSRRLAALVLGLGLGLGPILLADELVRLTLQEYKKRREASISREAYDRARSRIATVRVGMRADQFFDSLEMLVARDAKGKGVDGFVDGHLPMESLEMTKGHEPDHYVVFGYYEDWKKKKGAVKKFYVIFRDNVLTRVAFFDPAEGSDVPAATGI